MVSVVTKLVLAVFVLAAGKFLLSREMPRSLMLIQRTPIRRRRITLGRAERLRQERKVYVRPRVRYLVGKIWKIRARVIDLM